MSSITTINGGDLIKNSRADINTNFSNLNTDKIETSTLDTDTTLAANSDSKIATQKAVKAYIDSGGNQNASETTRGIVQEATDAQVTAGTATGSTGAKLFVTPAKLATITTTVLAPYQLVNVRNQGVTTRGMNSAGSVNIAHGLGVAPKIVRFTATGNNSGTSITFSKGTYNGTSHNCIYSSFAGSTNGTSGTSTTYALEMVDFSTRGIGLSLTVDATNLIITYTAISSGGDNRTMNILWEAEA